MNENIETIPLPNEIDVLLGKKVLRFFSRVACSTAAERTLWKTYQFFVIRSFEVTQWPSSLERVKIKS